MTMEKYSRNDEAIDDVFKKASTLKSSIFKEVTAEEIPLKMIDSGIKRFKKNSLGLWGQWHTSTKVSEDKLKNLIYDSKLCDLTEDAGDLIPLLVGKKIERPCGYYTYDWNHLSITKTADNQYKISVESMLH